MNVNRPTIFNVKNIGIIIIIVAVVGGVFVLLSIKKPKSPHKIKLPENITKNYYKAFEFSPKPKAKKIKKAKRKDKEIKKPLKITDIFTNIETIPANALDLAQKEYNRRAKGKIEIKVFDNKLEQYTSPQALTDSDWQGQGIAKNVSSLPINLDRTITANKFIEAVLVNGIDSTLGGKVTAQINHNVYGGSGNKILIPIGSSAIGFYTTINKIGKTRLSIKWQRIITPIGVNIMIADANGADGTGKSGITGLVDNRSFDRYGVALLTSTLNAIAILKVPVESAQQQAVINTVGKDLSSLSSKILEETLEIKPRILVAKGKIITISLSSDIWIHKKTRNTAILEKVVHGASNGKK